MSNIRVRFPPSPTGPLHIGGARTALFNYLFAKKNKGKFILRIEDTDLERSDKKYEKDIFEGLRWLGIETDESPEIGGPYGPYRQSERISHYKKYIEKLLAEGKAFYCFHSEEELENEKTEQLKNKASVRHLCREWRDTPLEKAEKKRTAGESSIIRFKIPRAIGNEQITWGDLVRGQGHSFIGPLGDFSIAKGPDTPLYNFAVAVDDYEMKITHVIRGEDHISNTPKQLLIAEALGWTKKDKIGNTVAPWEYAHLPLILAPDRSKLSKRHGATSVNEYRQAGYLPEALFNFMALLGWNPGGEKEIFSKKELIKEFSLDKVQKSGAVFDLAKLDWMNGEYIRKKSREELTELCLPYLRDFLKFQIPNSKFQTDYLEKVVALEQPRLKKLSEIGERTEYFFREPRYGRDLLKWENMTDGKIIDSLEAAEKVISNFQFPISKEKLEKAFLEKIGAGDKGEILWPLRVALSGKKNSPGPFEIMEILGTEESLKRLKIAKEKLKTSS